MPFNGNGQFDPASPQYPAIVDTPILASAWNTIVEDIAAGLSLTWTRDGQAGALANLSMGGFKLRDLSNAVNPQDAVTLNQATALLNLSAVIDTSSSSVLIATGAKAFTVTAGKPFQPGMWLVLADTAAPSTNAVYGTVTSYVGTTLLMNIVGLIGGGTIAAWSISQSAPGAIASLVSNAPAGGNTGTNVQAVLNALDARIGSLSAVRGLIGIPNTATPLTKYDLSVSGVTLRNASTGMVARGASGVLTCDITLAGPVANGRDQAAAFAANTFVFKYIIWNGAALAAIVSAAPPVTGPTLPAGYTHWAFASVARLNAAVNIVPSRTNGAVVWYDVAGGGVTRIIANGVATVMTPVGDGSYIPAIALRVHFSAQLIVVHASAAGFDLIVRPTGAANTGQVVASAYVPVANGTGQSAAPFSLPNGASTSLDYKLSAAPSIGGGAYIDIVGYTIANGDS